MFWQRFGAQILRENYPKSLLPSGRSFAQQRGTNIHNSLPGLNSSYSSENSKASNPAAICWGKHGFPTGKCLKHLRGSRRKVGHSSGTAETLPSHFATSLKFHTQKFSILVKKAMRVLYFQTHAEAKQTHPTGFPSLPTSTKTRKKKKHHQSN